MKVVCLLKLRTLFKRVFSKFELLRWSIAGLSTAGLSVSYIVFVSGRCDIFGREIFSDESLVQTR